MKEKVIEFETAKKAKEKGFNNPDIRHEYKGVYALIDLIIEQPGLDGYWEEKIDKKHYFDKEPRLNDEYRERHMFKKDVFAYAPTQALLQRYLREEHNIHIWANPGNTKRPKGTFEVNVSTNNETTFYHYGYETYEEALEQGLQEGLKYVPLSPDEKYNIPELRKRNVIVGETYHIAGEKRLIADGDYYANGWIDSAPVCQFGTCECGEKIASWDKRAKCPTCGKKVRLT